MQFEYFQPVSIRFGAGAARTLPSILDDMNVSRALLVCDDFLMDLGKTMMEASNGRIAEAVGGIRPNPTVENVDRIAGCCKDLRAQAIVAMGGGSVLDAAKMAGALAVQGHSAREYLAGGRKLGEGRIPVIALPTTAGTGSEVTMVSVLSDEQTDYKGPIGHPVLFATMALVDPELTRTVPAAVTAATGMDALSHALEAYWSVHHQPICDALAQTACEKILAHLEAAYRNGDDLVAREGLSLGALLAGLAFAQAKTAGVHACSYPLTVRYHMSHGAACAFTLDAFVEVNGRADGRLDALASALGLGSARLLSEKIKAMKQAMRLPCTLAQAGIPEGDIRALAEACCAHALMKNNPVAMTADSLTELFEGLA
ncbi:MAG TPA: iron-containing alcohol dehydrogenase [Clostridia bacterium]|nr:iron-containing alcohol dehydrogenase [Clostridia bacterium]